MRKPLRVLVADDQIDAAQTLGAILEDEGHQVCLAYDGVQVLDQARQFAPDVAILDIQMPQLDGYDAARALRKRHPGIVLIAVTAWKQGADRIFARAAGFDHHFGKPCRPADIIQVLPQA